MEEKLTCPHCGMDVTTQDILNLAASFEKIQVNRDLGNGYQLNEKFRNLVLEAIMETTERYLKQLRNEH